MPLNNSDDVLSKILAYVDSPFKLFAVILMAILVFGAWAFYENKELIVGTYKESQKLPSIAEDRVDDAFTDSLRVLVTCLVPSIIPKGSGIHHLSAFCSSFS